MTHPFFAVTKFLAAIIQASAPSFLTLVKPAILTGTAPTPALVNYLLMEGGDVAAGQHRWFIYGRVRRSAQRLIIEWQTRRATTAGNFAIYRSRTPLWREARPLDLSIFATADSQTGLTTYRAVDTTAASSGPYYYWLVNLTAKHSEQRYGPYSFAPDLLDQHTK